MTSISTFTESFNNLHSSTAPDRSQDEEYAGKTILRFLCLHNVDCVEIENYLMHFPECLRDEKERHLLEERLKKQILGCTCFGSSCNLNRRGILRSIRRGYLYYNSVRRVNPYNSIFMDSVELAERKKFTFQLQTIGRDLRSISTRKTEVERQIADALFDVSSRRHQLECVSKIQESNRTPLSLLQCKKVKVDTVEERISLEKSFAVATLRISSLEQELRLLAVEQDAAIRLEQAILKKAFATSRRHVCNTHSNDVL
jgi:hypothetical protein